MSRPNFNPFAFLWRQRQRTYIVLLAACLAATVGHSAALEDAGEGIYEGDLVGGVREGQGTLAWRGYRYEGMFRAGRMHGEGVLTTPAGTVYRGEFRDGERHGRGTLRMRSGDAYSGEFEADEIAGSGHFEWANGDVYEGGFAAGEPHGSGIFRYADGRVYRGNVDEGVRQGLGELTWANGNRYAGHFARDQRHGLGHYHWRDGTLYRGHFAFDRQHGPGIKELPNGEYMFEMWNGGEMTAARPVQAVSRCQLQVDGRSWMFESDLCVNGLAHGDGNAVRLDGLAYVLDGRFVLGNLVRGEVRSVAFADFAEPPAIAALPVAGDG